MGGLYNKNLRLPCFRAIEITGSLKIDRKRTVPLRQVLLLQNDKETLEFVEHNIARFVHSAIMMKEMAVLPEQVLSTCLPSEIESFLESTVLNPHKNILHQLTASLKKAILSLAMIRFNGDKEVICNVLGLSGSQFEEEMRMAGLCQGSIKKGPDHRSDP